MAWRYRLELHTLGGGGGGGGGEFLMSVSPIPKQGVEGKVWGVLLLQIIESSPIRLPRFACILSIRLQYEPIFLNVASLNCLRISIASTHSTHPFHPIYCFGVSWPRLPINRLSSNEKPRLFQAVNGIAENRMTKGQNVLPVYYQYNVYIYKYSVSIGVKRLRPWYNIISTRCPFSLCLGS